MQSSHTRVGEVTCDKNRARYRRQCCVFFVAAIQNGRVITYPTNPRVLGFTGAKFFPT